MSNIKAFSDLVVGEYYLPVFKRIEPWGDGFEFVERYDTSSPFFKYLGGKDFLEEESDEAVDCFYDPQLGLYVASNAPDGFIQ